MYCACAAVVHLAGSQGLQPGASHFMAVVILLAMPAGAAAGSRTFGAVAAILLPDVAQQVLRADPVLSGETAGCNFCDSCQVSANRPGWGWGQLCVHQLHAT